jgi:Ca2+-binding EF-hand superfamily protein
MGALCNRPAPAGDAEDEQLDTVAPITADNPMPNGDFPAGGASSKRNRKKHKKTKRRKQRSADTDQKQQPDSDSDSDNDEEDAKARIEAASADPSGRSTKYAERILDRDSYFDSYPCGALVRAEPETIALFFRRFDSDGDGVLSQRELLDLADQCIVRILHEFAAHLKHRHTAISPDELEEKILRERYYILPSLSKGKMRAGGNKPGVVAERFRRCMARELVRQLDINGDGSVTKNKFVIAWPRFAEKWFDFERRMKDAQEMSEAVRCALM